MKKGKSIRFDDAIAGAVEEEAKKQSRTFSAMVLLILKQWIEKHCKSK